MGMGRGGGERRGGAVLGAGRLYIFKINVKYERRDGPILKINDDFKSSRGVLSSRYVKLGCRYMLVNLKYKKV